MDRNGQVRKEPTLADLEAFEKLLRDSLQAEPAKEPALAASAPAHAPHTDSPPAASADSSAMAELARLIETPVEFDQPLRGAFAPTPPAPVEAPQPGFAPASEHHLHGSAEAALAHEWKAPQTVEASFSPASAPQPAAQPPLDPLAAFEEELRRFDAIRVAEQPAAPAHPVETPVAATVYPPADYASYHDAPRAETPIEGNWYQPAEPQRPDYPAESRAESSLNAAEERLAAEAAAGAAAAGVATGSGRSKGIFLALGGIAVAGLAVIGGSFVMGSGKKGGSSGDVPTIAAKTEPTKEKPADPGGIEIPNQNKQVLAARNTPETKPAAVVNTTEQPLDLNQVTKRDSVRVIAPNPFQPQPGVTPPAAGSDAPAPVTAGPAVEPRRVQSIRIPMGGSEAAPAPASAPAVGAAGAVGAAATLAGASARPSTPPPAPVAPPAPRVDPAAGAPAKVESRPTTAQPRPETPKVAPPPKVATAPAATPAAPKATPPKTANAPLSLTPPKTTAPAGGGSSGFAIQLASRPTEADARSASTQLRAKFASALGSRSPSVVSGEANGQTVYRVRVGGYSQADAVAACTKIKAAGGGCFVTKQ